jgi:hypothetical protein
LAWDEHAHQPGFGCRLDGLVWETVVAIHLRRQRSNRFLRQFPNCGAEARVLGRKLEIQFRR